MTVRKFAVSDAAFERSPGQDGEVFAANLIDQRHGGPITIGYGRYGANQSLEETIAVDDVMVVLEGRLSVSTNAGTWKIKMTGHYVASVAPGTTTTQRVYWAAYTGP